jgi:hypothetical protein
MDGTQFIVFFEDPFWIGIVDSVRDGKRFLNRVVFGAEPTNAQLVLFMVDDFALALSGAAEVQGSAPRTAEKRIGARRGMRKAAREQRGSPTKALSAYHAAFEKKKAEQSSRAAAAKEAVEELRYEKRLEKIKKARRGK